MLLHRVAHLEQNLIGIGEADEALRGILDLQRGINGQRDRERKRDRIEPASPFGSHTVARQKGGASAKDEEEKEDNGRRVHVERVLARGRDVDHLIQGRKQQFGGIGVCPGCANLSDRLLPDLPL